MAEADVALPVVKPKKGKLKFILIGVVALLLIGGGGVGFAVFKGLGPFAKKKPPVVPEKPKVATKKPIPRPTESAPTTVVRNLPPTTKVDPDEGASKLAKLWNQLEPTNLLAIAKDWKDPDLARVTIKMESGQVAELLSAMPPKRASALSKEMQRIASIVPADN